MAKTRRIGGSKKHFKKRRFTKNLHKRSRKSRRHTRKRYGGVPLPKINRQGQAVSTHGIVRKPNVSPVAQSLQNSRVTSTRQAVSTHGMVRKPVPFKKSKGKGLLNK